VKILAIPLIAIALATTAMGAESGPSPAPSGESSPAPAAPSDSTAPALAPPKIVASGTVVDSSTLITLLPAAPSGWTADKPEGSTTDSTGFAMTTVSCVYVAGDADNAPTATLNIVDSANNQQFADATKVMWSATSNSTLGYDKTITIDGLPGFEHYTNADQTGTLWVVVAGRYFVQIETTRQPAAALETWLGRIDLKKLEALQ
jgi:hypothetical protein